MMKQFIINDAFDVRLTGQATSFVSSNMSLVSMTIKVSPDFRDQFIATAEAIGISPSEALKILAQRFIDEGGFPFDVQPPQIHLDQDDPKVIQTYHKDGKLMMPAAWRDDDNQDDADDDLRFLKAR